MVRLISPCFISTLGTWNLFGTYGEAASAPGKGLFAPFLDPEEAPTSRLVPMRRTGQTRSLSAAADRFRDLWEARTQAAETPARIVQARAMVLCAFPYTRISERSVTRTARIGPETRISVTFTSVDPAVPLPFGADRALFAWMQTQSLHRGRVDFGALSQYFDAFRLGSSGREYRVARERLRRLESLAMTIRVESPETEEVVRLHPLKRASKPRLVEIPCEERLAGALTLRRGRFGFELDPDFWQHIKSHPVPLPLALMRQFHNRPQAWDFAAFLFYRSFAARSASVVPWDDLVDQLGSRDSFPRRLKASLARVLREIWVVFPGFPPRFLPGFQGLAVEPWR